MATLTWQGETAQSLSESEIRRLAEDGLRHPDTQWSRSGRTLLVYDRDLLANKVVVYECIVVRHAVVTTDNVEVPA